MEETTETVETTVDPDEPKGLRKQLSEAHGKIKELQAKNLESAYGELGLDTSRGFGKAVAKEYDGEASKDALTGWLKSEYEWEPTPQVEAHPQAQAITQGHEQLEQVAQTAGSVVAPTQDEQLAAAEAAGDYTTTMGIKGQQVAKMFNPDM